MSVEHDDRSLHISTNKPSPVIMKTMGLNKEGFHSVFHPMYVFFWYIKDPLIFLKCDSFCIQVSVAVLFFISSF